MGGFNRNHSKLALRNSQDPLGSLGLGELHPKLILQFLDFNEALVGGVQLALLRHDRSVEPRQPEQGSDHDED